MRTKASSLAQIRLIYQHLRAVVDVLGQDNPRATRAAIVRFGEHLSHFGNQSLENRIIDYLARKNDLVSVLAGDTRIKTDFVVVSAKQAARTTLQFSDLISRIRCCSEVTVIVDERIGRDNADIIHTLVRTFGLKELVLTGGYLSAFELRLLRRASSLIFQTHWNTDTRTMNAAYYRLPLESRVICKPTEQYRVTLISSVFNGEKYIPSFIDNLSESTMFHEVQVMIFDAGPEYGDFWSLAPYLAKFKNIRYFKLSQDPGLYDIWNIGIHLSESTYVGNSNLDDRRHPLQLQALVSTLDSDNSLALVSTHVVPMSDFKANYITYLPEAPHVYFSWMAGKYSCRDMFVQNDKNKLGSQCVPHCMPLWRKDLHRTCGYFHEEIYKSAADFELWLRGLAKGLKYGVVPIPASYYYVNPTSYMRVDSAHHAVVEDLHAIYLAGNAPQRDAHYPDFDRLLGLIEFQVN